MDAAAVESLGKVGAAMALSMAAFGSGFTWGAAIVDW